MSGKHSLLKDITDKAEATFCQPITKNNFDEWCRHWIATGDEWERCLRAEGLTLTADAVKGHVDFERRGFAHPESTGPYPVVGGGILEKAYDQADSMITEGQK